ncbi:MAG: DNA-processing protein DprA [Sphaerochaeta sp.]|nr:DNA-processing protein DprA [Sphaerochaeta sp.]
MDRTSLGSSRSPLTNHTKQTTHILSSNDDHPRHLYPPINTPLILYSYGKLSHPDTPVVGIIRSHSYTSSAEVKSKAFMLEPIGKGTIIASGLSFGIDALAHATIVK